MRIDWFSPTWPARTDIAHYTGRVVPAVRTLHEVTIWTDNAGSDTRAARRFTYPQLPWVDLQAGNGVAFYNIGNNPEFHGGIWRVSRLHPGIVILHDPGLQHLFGGLFRDRWRDFSTYALAMHRYYGDEAVTAARAYFAGEIDTDEMMRRYPLTAFGVERALAVIVHSPAAHRAVADLGLPVLYSPLPFVPTGPDASLREREVEAKWQIDGPRRLIAFGFIGPNRRLEPILHALSLPRFKGRFRLDIAGELWDPALVKRWIKRLGLDEHVTVHGFLPEDALDSMLARAHLAFNLRNPTVGEASGSQLRIWNHALPSLVSKVGWYAELPTAVVRHVSLSEEEKDIAVCLDELLHDPKPLIAQGLAGRRKLEQEHSPDSFASRIDGFLNELDSFRSRFNAHWMAARACLGVAKLGVEGQLLARAEKQSGLLTLGGAGIERFLEERARNEKRSAAGELDAMKLYATGTGSLSVLELLMLDGRLYAQAVLMLLNRRVPPENKVEKWARRVDRNAMWRWALLILLAVSGRARLRWPGPVAAGRVLQHWPPLRPFLKPLASFARTWLRR